MTNIEHADLVLKSFQLANRIINNYRLLTATTTDPAIAEHIRNSDYETLALTGHRNRMEFLKEEDMSLYEHSVELDQWILKHGTRLRLEMEASLAKGTLTPANNYRIFTHV